MDIKTRSGLTLTLTGDSVLVDEVVEFLRWTGVVSGQNSLTFHPLRAEMWMKKTVDSEHESGYFANVVRSCVNDHNSSATETLVSQNSR